MREGRLRYLGLLLAMLLFTVPAQAAAPVPEGLDRVKHIIILYLDGRSFDSLYGYYPGVAGLEDAESTEIQVNQTDLPYQSLPPVIDRSRIPPVEDPRFPPTLPNHPFDADRYLSLTEKTGDMVQRFYQEQGQIDGGRMDKYVLFSAAGALPMAYYDSARLPLRDVIKSSVLADHFFHAAFGGAMLNHMWLICGCTPAFPNAPKDITAEVDPGGRLLKDGDVTPEGYAVNDLQPANPPHLPGIAADHLLPPQTLPTIGDRLSDKGISWAWYAAGYNDAVAGHPSGLFRFEKQPFLYFARYAPGTQARAEHLKDETDMLAALDKNTLPDVTFWKPAGSPDDRLGYSDVASSEGRAGEILTKIIASEVWGNSMIIITYDSNGGSWDHVAPPRADRWGPGTRVPAIVVSPFGRNDFIDHTVYDTTAILKLIELRFGLDPLGPRDAAAPTLAGTLRFTGRFIAPAPPPPPKGTATHPATTPAPAVPQAVPAPPAQH